MTYRLVPLKRDVASRFVDLVHRHLDPSVGDVIRVGLAHKGRLVAAAVAGRPVAGGLDDGWTLEVTRVAVETAPLNPHSDLSFREQEFGHPQACSRLYGAICRAATALGYWRVYTYTRADEPGTSPAAAGFVRDGEVRGREWDCDARPRDPVAQPVDKVRWVRILGPAPEPVLMPEVGPDAVPQLALWSAA